MKTVYRSRLVFTRDNPYGYEHPKNYANLEATFNITNRDYIDRSPDMVVVLDDGTRLRVLKQYVAGVKELALKQVQVEANVEEE